MTEKEKECYNTYLSISRSSRSKPYKIRSNFDGFESESDYLYVQKICNFLNRFPQVQVKSYFKAPFILYPDQDYFPLEYFASQKAIKAYTTYLKQQREQSPDTDESLSFIKESIRYIGMFCIMNKIPLNQYIYHKIGCTYSWERHLKDFNICIYPLFEWADFPELVKNLPEDEKGLFLGDMADNILVYKDRLWKSTKARTLVKEGIRRIKDIVNDSTKKDKIND